jgi:hypothetical protein
MPAASGGRAPQSRDDRDRKRGSRVGGDQLIAFGRGEPKKWRLCGTSDIMLMNIGPPDAHRRVEVHCARSLGNLDRRRSTHQFIEGLRTVSFVTLASRAAGRASHERGYASAADPEAGSAENREA